MSELGPTSTEHEPTATERLRALLTERGVEWKDYGYENHTWWGAWHAENRPSVNGLFMKVEGVVTPEQAIAATLGRDNAGKYVGLRRGKYWERTENSDYYCGGCGWKVTDHDSYCPECGGALHESTLGSCNCSNNCTNGERTSDSDATGGQMSITDELRDWASGAKPAVVDGCSISVGAMTHGCKKALLAIADRIDAEHEAACAEAYGNGAMSVPIALDESQWVKLPVDADGVPIRVGDVLTDGEYTFVVDELAAFGGGSWSIRNEDGNAWKPCDVTHHHKPTVEDVLRDVVTLCHNTWREESPFHFYDVDDVMKSSNIAEFASRLRLVGDAE